MGNQSSLGQFVRYYVNFFYVDPDTEEHVERYVSTPAGDITHDFKQAHLFDMFEQAELVAAKYAEFAPLEYGAIIRKVNCEVDGFHLGYIIK